MVKFLLAIGGSGFTTSAPRFKGTTGEFFAAFFVLVMIVAVLLYVLTVTGKRRRK